MRIKAKNISALVFLLTVSGIIYTSGRYDYTGTAKCSECHSNASIGNQTAVWNKSPHSKAYKVLQTEYASEIASKFSITEPSTDLKCLRCHTTGGGKTEISATEGVGCEACHGPGEAYQTFENHASFIDRPNAYKTAISFGMYPIIGENHIRNREKLCRGCHSQDPDVRLCLPEDIEKRRDDILSLDAIANFIFPHPVAK